jgi:hypothetical protein
MKLLLVNISPFRIVCFTLTNAAVNEVLDRLVEEVKWVANSNYDEFCNYSVAVDVFK